MFSSQQSQVSSSANYIEDVFSTYLYTGNDGTKSINNGIDLSGKGGLLWIKNRSGANANTLVDSATSVNGRYYLISNTTNGLYDTGGTSFAFGNSGFTLNNAPAQWNSSSYAYTSWTFRKQPKFFDVVTYTGTGSNSGNDISHSLGSLPGFLVFKCTSTTSNWCVLAQNSDGNYETLFLNATDSSYGAYSATTSAITSTTFNPGKVWGNDANASGQTYVAYLFASNAGGFGLAGTDSVISCGSYIGANTDGYQTGDLVNLGWEPQFVLIKAAQTTSFGNMPWTLFDNLRGMSISRDGSVGGQDATLTPNDATVEDGSNNYIEPDATGFKPKGGARTNAVGKKYIYIAIRRGPMKVPTDATKVFQPSTTSSSNEILSTLEAADFGIFKKATDSSEYPNWLWGDRLRGITYSTSFLLNSNNSNAEYSWSGSGDGVTAYYGNIGSSFGDGNIKGGGAGGTYTPTIYAFKRAPSFMDEVCYMGNGGTNDQPHNLTVTPEFAILKCRTNADTWLVYSASLGNSSFMQLNSTAAVSSNSNWFVPTNSLFTLGSLSNTYGRGYVAYLFATLANVSKVGSYTGTGATQTINCGFTGGARFVLIKRTDDVGSWYVWDTARGMVAGTDPRLFLNSTSGQSNSNWVYTASTGFQIVTTDATVNASGGNYIYLAIA